MRRTGDNLGYHPSAILRFVSWYLVIDLSGQNICLILKHQAVSDNQTTPHNIAADRMPREIIACPRDTVISYMNACKNRNRAHTFTNGKP
jgi:hypothetical protein